MKKFDVEITETLQRKVSVEAASQEDAERMVTQAWNNQDYVLDSGDFTGVDFKTVGEHELAETRTMDVLLVQPNAYPKKISVGTELEDLQAMVGGDIEVTYPFEDEVAIILNESGKINTHTILVELLKSKESFDDGILDGIISAFLAQCEKDNLYPWNYYYVKYPVFRPGSYGKMSNDDVVNKPYMFSVMQTKTQWSQNTYMPYLKEADDDHLSRDEMGQYLVYDDVYIVCENNSYGVYRNDDDSLTDTVTISQNEAGIDTEDRIIKLKKYIANMK